MLHPMRVLVTSTTLDPNGEDNPEAPWGVREQRTFLLYCHPWLTMWGDVDSLCPMELPLVTWGCQALEIRIV